MLRVAKQRGFTIVELLIVVVVIAILAAITIVAYTGIQQRVKLSSAQSTTASVSKKILTYAIENGDQYPANLAAIGISDNGDTKYQYVVSNTVPRTFCVTVSMKDISYFSSNSNSTPLLGGCDGHGVNGVEAAINYVPNPNFETNNSFWGSFWNPVITAETASPYQGARSLRFAQAAGDATSGRSSGLNLNNTAMPAVEEGARYSASLWANVPSGASLMATFKNSSGYTGRGTVWLAGNGSWQRFVIPEYTAIAADAGNASKLTLQLIITSGQNTSAYAPAGTSVAIDSVMMEIKSPTSTAPGNNAYADGSSTKWVWSGALNGSTSTGPAL